MTFWPLWFLKKRLQTIKAVSHFLSVELFFPPSAFFFWMRSLGVNNQMCRVQTHSWRYVMSSPPLSWRSRFVVATHCQRLTTGGRRGEPPVLTGMELWGFFVAGGRTYVTYRVSWLPLLWFYSDCLTVCMPLCTLGNFSLVGINNHSFSRPLSVFLRTYSVHIRRARKRACRLKQTCYTIDVAAGVLEFVRGQEWTKVLRFLPHGECGSPVGIGEDGDESKAAANGCQVGEYFQ